MGRRAEPGAACVRADCGDLASVLRRQFCGDDAGLFLVFEPIALALDVDGGGVMEQPVQDGRGDDVVGEDGAPIAVAHSFHNLATTCCKSSMEGTFSLMVSGNCRVSRYSETPIGFAV